MSWTQNRLDGSGATTLVCVFSTSVYLFMYFCCPVQVMILKQWAKRDEASVHTAQIRQVWSRLKNTICSD
jgi:hypothetical protein